MNRTPIEWCDFTWNPLTGCWGPGGTWEKPNWCFYCYAPRTLKRVFAMQPGLQDGWGYGPDMRPTFWTYRLGEPRKVKKPSRIFVCSLGDLFGEWVPEKWIKTVLEVVKKCPWHTFIFLTKNPRRYQEFTWPGNCILLTTITNQADADERILELLKADCRVKGVSIEPILGAINLFRAFGTEGPRQTYIEQLHWLIIGAMTGPGSKQYRPDRAWVHNLWDQGKAAGAATFIKNNVGWPERIQEFPI